MNLFDIAKHPHTRVNLLTGETVLVSPHRNKRPWQGKVEALPAGDRPTYDPTCYLCPGNSRADGTVNTDYKEPFVFTNDFSALLLDAPEGEINNNDLLIASSEKGICRVISFSPDHSLTLPEMSLSDLEKVVEVWIQEYKTIGANPAIKYIQIFENRGEIMGSSNPHPHGQIWASSSLPVEIRKETQQQRLYFEKHHISLLSAYLNIELKEKERLLLENDHFVALVPFWAVWPYETMIISRRHITGMHDFTNDDKSALADILKQLTIRYDNLFQVSFPYSAGIHQAPVNDGLHPGWHWHMHFYPPLLRSATVKKFMVGYEMLANPQRDITPEMATSQLRALPELHYKQAKGK